MEALCWNVVNSLKNWSESCIYTSSRTRNIYKKKLRQSCINTSSSIRNIYLRKKKLRHSMTECYLAGQAVLCDQGWRGPRAAGLPKPILSGSSYPENCQQAYRYANYSWCFFNSLPGLMPGEHQVTSCAYKHLPSALAKRCGTKPRLSFLSGGTNKVLKRYVSL